MKTTFDYFRYLMMAMAAVFSFAACSDDDNEGGGNKNAEIVLITPENGQITCLGTGVETQTIVFTASNDWTATTEQGWLQLSKRTGGAGESQSIYLTIEDNDSFEKSRIGTVTIKDKTSGKSKDIVVTQGEKGATIVFSSPTEGELVIDNEAQSITAAVNVLCNYDFTIKIDKEWLGYQKGDKNEDGSVAYSFIADPAKLVADGGYAAKEATISFEYQAETRAVPETKTYKIKFSEFVPTLSFEVAGEAVTEENMPIKYQESLDEAGKFYASVTVVSNYKWRVGQAPDNAKVTLVEGIELPPYNPETGEGGVAGEKEDVTIKVNGTDFFESKTTIRLDYLGDAASIEPSDVEEITFVDVVTDVVAEDKASFQFPGLGNDYLELVREYWTSTNNYRYMFAATGEEGEYAGMYEDPASITITIKAAHPDKVAVYAIKLDGDGMFPTREYIDEEYPDEPISNDATGGWNAWVYIEDETVNFRSSVQEVKKVITMKARNEYESMMGDPRYTWTAGRYWAMLVVDSDKYPTYESLFYTATDETEGLGTNGDLKDELRDKIALMGQEGFVAATMDDFETVDWPDGNVFNVSAAGETIVLKYSGLDLSDVDTWAPGLYVGGSMDDKEFTTGWNYLPSVSPLFAGVVNILDVETKGEIKIRVAANETGKPRSEVCAIANGNENKFFATFKIEQAAQ